MRSLKYSINLTLNGGFDHREMIPDKELHMRATESLANAGALIFGRVIYQMMEDAWRPVAESGIRPEWMEEWMVPFAKVIHSAKKYVVSDSLNKVDWNSEIVRGADLETTVRSLKHLPGNYLYCGGVKLPSKLAELGLIDDYEFIIHPRIAKNDESFFAKIAKPLELKFVNSQPYQSGAVAMRYSTY